MQRTSRSIALAVLLVLLPSAPARAEWDGNVNFFLGQKWLNQDDWEPFDEQPEFGVLASWGRSDWPIHIATDLLMSFRERDVFGAQLPERAHTVELGAGVRKIWTVGKDGSTRPYFGGGLAIVSGGFEDEILGGTLNHDDDNLGFWLSGGVFWRLGKRFNIGFDARLSTAEIQPVPGAGEIDAGGFHLGLLLGFGW